MGTVQHIDYDSQLQFKTKMVEDALQHIAGLERPSIPADDRRIPGNTATGPGRGINPTCPPAVRLSAPLRHFYAQAPTKWSVEDCAIQAH